MAWEYVGVSGRQHYWMNLTLSRWKSIDVASMYKERITDIPMQWTDSGKIYDLETFLENLDIE